jgi:hypothetical protein
MLQDYKLLLEEQYRRKLRISAAGLQNAFAEFSRVVSEGVRVVHWDDLAGIVAGQQRDFWADYFARVEAAYTQARTAAEARKAVDGVRSRLENAGVSLGAMPPERQQGG